jgi:hypothetical protein
MQTYSDTVLFEAFKRSLHHLVRHDEEVLSWPKAKGAIAHVLALALQQNLNNLQEGLYVDIMTQGADIILHDRSETLLLGIVFSNTYLSAAHHRDLRQLQRRGCRLVFGIAFLKEKPYFLLYHLRRGAIEYHHYRRIDGSVTHLRERERGGDEGQLMLGIKPKQKRRRSTADR